MASEELSVLVKGATCASCFLTVERAIRNDSELAENVVRLSSNTLSGVVTLSVRPEAPQGRFLAERVVHTIQEVGFEAQVLDQVQSRDHMRLVVNVEGA